MIQLPILANAHFANPNIFLTFLAIQRALHSIINYLLVLTNECGF